MAIIPFLAHFRLGYYFNVAIFLLILVLTVRILLDNRNPSWSISMLLVLYFIPVVGVIFYFLNGVNWQKRKIVKHIPERIFKANLQDNIRDQQDFLLSVPPEYENDSVKAIRMLLSSSGALLTLNNSAEFYSSGAVLFDDMIESISKAKKSIHLEYFIWRSDELGERMKDLLILKAAEGVEVRLIFDGVGCFRAMKLRYKRELRRAGVQIRYFLDPLNPFTGWLMNYCNHRKIAVIDGITGYTGGMNVGSEYIDGGERFASWRDTHIRLEGDSVNLLQAVFMADWENSGGRLENEKDYIVPAEPGDRLLPVQIVTSGPDSDWHSLKELYFTMISNANEEILIASPYFVVDSAIEEALVTASLAGVRVRLVMTGAPPDKWVPYWVAYTYYERLISAGAEFYQYTDGFYHSKFLVADGKMATAGTCNMDIRSFHLHYEINAVFYSREKAQQLREVFFEDMNRSRRVSIEECRNLSFPRKLRNSVFRIFAPLL